MPLLHCTITAHANSKSSTAKRINVVPHLPDGTRNTIVCTQQSYKHLPTFAPNIRRGTNHNKQHIRLGAPEGKVQGLARALPPNPPQRQKATKISRAAPSTPRHVSLLQYFQYFHMRRHHPVGPPTICRRTRKHRLVFARRNEQNKGTTTSTVL